MSDQSVGHRGADVADAREFHPRMTPGEYRKVANYPPDGSTIWECCTPNGLASNLRSHTVVEHEDGTITVSPSILVETHSLLGEWHGWLECGTWRAC